MAYIIFAYRRMSNPIDGFANRMESGIQIDTWRLASRMEYAMEYIIHHVNYSTTAPNQSGVAFIYLFIQSLNLLRMIDATTRRIEHEYTHYQIKQKVREIKHMNQILKGGMEPIMQLAKDWISARENGITFIVVGYKKEIIGHINEIEIGLRGRMDELLQLTTYIGVRNAPGAVIKKGSNWMRSISRTCGTGVKHITNTSVSTKYGEDIVPAVDAWENNLCRFMEMGSIIETDHRELIEYYNAIKNNLRAISEDMTAIELQRGPFTTNLENLDILRRQIQSLDPATSHHIKLELIAFITFWENLYKYLRPPHLGNHIGMNRINYGRKTRGNSSNAAKSMELPNWHRGGRHQSRRRRHHSRRRRNDAM